MTKFVEGDFVEVTDPSMRDWREGVVTYVRQGTPYYTVEFPDGTSAVYGEVHIRAVKDDMTCGGWFDL